MFQFSKTTCSFRTFSGGENWKMGSKWVHVLLDYLLYEDTAFHTHFLKLQSNKRVSNKVVEMGFFHKILQNYKFGNPANPVNPAKLK